MLALQAWKNQVLGWDKQSLPEAQLKDPNIDPALGWCEANERFEWSVVYSAQHAESTVVPI